jgi:APA family basic amino acid/polyamine antiporter
MWRSLFRKKAIDVQAEHSLLRYLGLFDLTLLGIGAIIGAGIFVITGVAAATQAGPALIISFIFSGTAAMFAALAYAELAASIGGCGSAYGYAYVGFGEIFAWMIGWDLLLEYSLGMATVAIGWSGYVKNVFEGIGFALPEALTRSPFQGGDINLLAVFIVLAVTGLLAAGIKSTARFNALVVTIKLFAIAVFIGIAVFNVQPANWQNFMPFGWSGVMAGAGLVFFAYIGFDALSTAVEESVEPQYNVPRGIMLSLAVCTTLYILVSILLTGIVPYTFLNVSSPISDALLKIGYPFGAALVAAGAIAGLTTVMIVLFYGLSRICLAMSLDGLLPGFLGKINSTTKAPVRLILVLGCLIAPLAGLLPIDRAAELVNIGTLMAFIFVCAGVIYLRKTQPDLPRPFRLPFSPLFPILGILSCFYLMVHLPTVTWLRFVLWALFGFVLYFIYGRSNSELE